MKKIPVLTYHSQNICGNEYQTNNHRALRDDLRAIHALGFQIVPLSWVAEWVLGQSEDRQLTGAIALTFDDGTDFDYHDITHPKYGLQQSFFRILCDFQEEVGHTAQPYLHASLFVVASPEARKDICRAGFAGSEWMHDSWWKEAHNSGLLSVCNHSWDHNLPEVRIVCEEHQRKGAFDVIDTYAECHAEIQQAAEYIHEQIAPAWPQLFAYPYGQSSTYLKEVYFPNFQDQHGTLAAFGTQGVYVTQESSRWNLPRFVCGADWRSPEKFQDLLNGAR